MTILKYIPFSYHWIVLRVIGSDVHTILDLGCGDGAFMMDLCGGKNWDITGIELHKPSLSKAKKFGIYNKLLSGDITNMPKDVISKKYDVVFSSQTLEHLNKLEGKKALKTWEKLARKKLVVTTPEGFIEYEPIEAKQENNKLQKHLSGWNYDEMLNLGFSVRGQGAKFIYAKNGIAPKYPKLLFVWMAFSFIVAPLIYFFPKLAIYMVACKKYS